MEGKLHHGSHVCAGIKKTNSLILIAWRLLKLLFILGSRLGFWGRRRWQSSLNTWARLTALRAGNWPFWTPRGQSSPLPRAAATVCGAHCPCLTGTLTLLTRFAKLIGDSDFRTVLFKASLPDVSGNDLCVVWSPIQTTPRLGRDLAATSQMVPLKFHCHPLTSKPHCHAARRAWWISSHLYMELVVSKRWDQAALR